MDFEDELTAAWASLDAHEEDPEGFRALIDKAVTTAPPAVAAFERACSLDSTGHSDVAVPLYREALDAGLAGYRRRRATIQLASSLRNVGRSAESVELLAAELATPVDEEAATLEDAVRAFLALALTDVGRAPEAVSLALTALAPHLPRYQRSLAAYAQALAE